MLARVGCGTGGVTSASPEASRSTPITVRMDPSLDGDLLSRMQRVGRLAERTTTFCPRLEPDRVAFQSLALPVAA